MLIFSEFYKNISILKLYLLVLQHINKYYSRNIVIIYN